MLPSSFTTLENSVAAVMVEKNLLEIWAGRKRQNILEELNLDKCIAHCRLDLVNRQLDELVNKPAEHKNFI